MSRPRLRAGFLPSEPVESGLRSRSTTPGGSGWAAGTGVGAMTGSAAILAYRCNIVSASSLEMTPAATRASKFGGGGGGSPEALAATANSREGAVEVGGGGGGGGGSPEVLAAK